YAPGNTAFSAAAIILGDALGTFTGNHVAGSSNNGVYFGNAGAGDHPIGTFANNGIHSNNDTNFYAPPQATGTISNLTSWRSSGIGVAIGAPGQTELVFDGLTTFGNGNIAVGGADTTLIATIKNATIAGDTSFGETCAFGYNAAATYST